MAAKKDTVHSGVSGQAKDTSGFPYYKPLIIGLMLLGSFVFMLVSWNSGGYIKTFDNISFKVVEKQDPDLLVGNKYIVQPGKEGLRIVYYEDLSGSRGKVLHVQTERKPTNEIVAIGHKPEAEVKTDAEGTIQGFLEAWKAADYQKMTTLANPKTLQGGSAADVADAYAATGEKLSGYTIGNLTLYRNNEWENKQNSYNSYDKTELSKPQSPGNAILIATVDIDYIVSCPRYKDASVKGIAYLLYSNKQWKIQYFGAIKKVAVNQAKTYESSSSFSNEKQQVTIDSIILYGDHFSILGSESNLSSGQYSSSVSSRLNSLSVSLQSGSQYVSQASGYSTELKYSLDTGTSQSGMVSYTPAIKKGDVVEIKAGYDLDFASVKIP